MNIKQYLDSTYLKTPEQSGLSLEETKNKVRAITDEAIDNGLFAVMIRPDFVKETKDYLKNKKSSVVLGTVIGFHEGKASVEEKLKEAQKAIDEGADELDFVINYSAYKNDDYQLIHDEFVRCTKLCLSHGKIAKWIIEIAALSNEQIADLTQHISDWAVENFKEENLKNIFVKSSTGFYKTEDGKPNGATFEGIQIMLDHAGKLPVKAAGGVRTPEDAEKMIAMGVQRIGTSSAMGLVRGESTEGY